MVQFRQQIARDDAARGRKHADLAGIIGRVVTGVFESLPANLQEQALLRVHESRIFG